MATDHQPSQAENDADLREASVLVVDDNPHNLELLQAYLEDLGCTIRGATDGREAIDSVAASTPDLILLDIMMPRMSGYQVCQEVKRSPETRDIPIIMVTALDQASDRVQGLEAGADDFLTKPVDDLAMTTRVKSLARLKHATDELKLRASTGASLGMETQTEVLDPRNGRDGKILIVDDRASSYERSVDALTQEHSVAVVTEPQEGLFRAADDDYDAIIISLGIDDFDPLRLCSQLRSLDRSRLVPILLVANKEDQMILIRAIDLGVNDYILRPLDVNELRARVRAQVRR